MDQYFSRKEQMMARDNYSYRGLGVSLFGIIVCGILVRPVFAEAPRQRTLRFSYSAEVTDIPEGTKKVDIWLPFPPSNEDQQITDVVISAPYVSSLSKESEYGNSILYLGIDNPKEKSVKLDLKFTVTRNELNASRAVAGLTRASYQADFMQARFLMSDRLVPLDAKVRDMAAGVVKSQGEVSSKARAIYDHAVSSMKYDKSGTGWGRGDIYYACDAKRGNCTDFHAVFTGFCRAVNVPARFEIGFPIPPERGEGKIGGYHCWAQYYVDGKGWFPVDASEAAKHPEQRDYLFGTLDENRILFTIGRDILLSPAQHGDRLNFFVYPYAEVDGKPFDKVKKEFSYKDLTQ